MNKSGPKTKAKPTTLEAGIPVCPAHLDDLAKKEWRRVTKILAGKNLVCELDSAILALYCQAYSRWVQAEEIIAQQGVTVVHPIKGTTEPHPCLDVATTAMRLVDRYSTALCFTPKSRQGKELKTSDPTEDKWAEIKNKWTKAV